ncbi:MAG: hypothetical protein EOP48_34855, partial [Sphingobacteriales bacterium]
SDVRWTEMAGFPCAGTWVGPQAIVDNVFAVLGREWADYRFELEQLIDGGEHVVGVGTYHGVWRATGMPMQARVAHVWRLEGGQVTAFEQFTDTKGRPLYKNAISEIQKKGQIIEAKQLSTLLR